ncbi:aminotransferase class I/II-fold pyridoxal phosphate-dependent enzyme [Pararhodospirillum photometricum]|uniref:Aminotransferase n=1 Tax=Pararhodospirillum photometricum DSM 122 TaxID=1150469 RepID=H6SKV2_PARPM|nr:aminotransferase class I/II-fold pyridoxal phosphate-dependent enzyme [Pararhodospirillum photometricum]CCG08617.1 Aminotransferase [Pararhodospirillum photometricum DSM 122]
MTALFPERLARRARGATLSPIAQASQKAAHLAQSGRRILSLTTGEPDFDTPEPIKEAARRALAAGATKYTPTAGTLALRHAVAARVAEDTGLAVGHDEVLISNGAKQAIYTAFAATVDEGDAVVIPAPYWPTFPASARINGATPVIVETTRATGFKLTPDLLAAALSPRTKWLVLNSPGNPTGALYDDEEIDALARVLRAHPGVLVLWDQIYGRIRFQPGPSCPWLRQAPDLRPRTLIIDGVSKSHAMTGWRIGWGVGPAPLIAAMEAVQSQVSSGPSAVGQAAALAALDPAADVFVDEARAVYARRAARVAAGLAGQAGLVAVAPQGGFFSWVDVTGLLGRRTPEGRRLDTDQDVADWLLEGHGVAVVAGAAHGQSPALRLSFATDDATLDEALARIAAAVASLLPEEDLA